MWLLLLLLSFLGNASGRWDEWLTKPIYSMAYTFTENAENVSPFLPIALA